VNKADRYILRLYWSAFTAGLLVFVTLFLATDAMSFLNRFANADSSAIIKYYSYYFPEILHKMIPVASLVGTVMTLSTLNKGSELIALFASGMSLFRICRYVFISVLLIAGLDYLMSDRILPLFSKQKNFIYYTELVKRPEQFQTIKTDRIWYRSQNNLFNIKTLTATGNKAQGLTIYFFDESWQLIQMIKADEVELNGNQWFLKKGSVSVFANDTSFPLVTDFDSKVISMSENAQDLRNTGQTSDLLTQSELSRFIDKNKQAGLDTIRYEVEFHSKFSFVLAGLVMSLLAIPFLVGDPRHGGSMVKNVGVCLGLVMAYWVLYSSAQTIGNHGQIHPLLAAWGANILMSLLGGYFLLRLRR
jgi:lipopolysaccharide export system permease protein